MHALVPKCVLLHEGLCAMRSLISFLASAALLASLSAVSRAAELPYDEHANAPEQIRQALQVAQSAHKDVLLVFGANWCPDCRVLDSALHGKGATSISDRFVVVKVDVGNFDRNLDLAKRYDVPLRKGIPAAAVLSGNDTLLYVTKAGELANAHRMGEPAIVDLLSRVVADAAPAGH
jgi:protein disulfide-isomerase